MLDQDPVDKFVDAARQVQRSASAREVAQAALAVVPGADAKLQAAVESCLAGLELSLAQITAASLELAHDQQIETRRQVARLLGTRADAELAESLAQVCVQAVAAFSDAPAIARAASGGEPGAVAVAGMSGAVFVSAQARKLAADHGLAVETLDAMLLAATQPIRAACAVAGICSVGELRRTVRQGALAASATLDRAQAGPPLIRILLHPADSAPAEGKGEAPAAPYAARVLRRLVS